MHQSHVTPRPYLRTPAIAPDGSQVAFIHAGDVWLVATGGGIARRVTAHYANHSFPRWSHTGDQLAFTSGRIGSGEVYLLPLDGGDVRRLTHHESYATPTCWAHDDQALYVLSNYERQGMALYRVDIAGSTPVAWLAQAQENLADVALSPDGSLLAVVIERSAWWRRGPNPYGSSELWICANAPGGTDAHQIETPPGMSRWPLWRPDGQGVYLVSDRDGTENIWYQPLEGGPSQITSFTDGRLLWPSISADGLTIVFERDFRLWRLSTRTGAYQPIDVQLSSDQKLNSFRVANYGRDLSELALSPDGKKVAMVGRGEVFADFADKETDKELRSGTAMRLTNTAARESDIAWTPDSRRLIYISDRHGDPEVYAYDFGQRGEQRLTVSPHPKVNPHPSPDGTYIGYISGNREIRLIDTRTGEDQPFITATLDFETNFAWSPDSQWIVFAGLDKHYFENLYVQRLGEERPRQITFLSNLTSSNPIWAPNGQFIVFTTGHYRAEMQVARVDLRPPAPFFREAEFEKLFESPRDTQSQGSPEPAGQPAKEARDKAADQKQAEQSQDSPEPLSTEPTPPEEPAPDQKEPPAPEPAKSTPPNSKAVEILFEGIDRRLRLLTPIQLDARALCVSPDSRDLIFRATVTGKLNLWTMPLDEPRAEQAPRQLTASATGKWAVQLSPDGKSLFFIDGGQAAIRKYPTGEQSYPNYTAEVQIDFTQEKWQIFGEAWRRLREEFFDPTFRGLDWNAVREQYTPLVAGAQTVGELFTLLQLMFGELRASHLGLYWRRTRSESDGYLGLRFDVELQAQTGRLMIASVVPESPAALAGLTAGLELLEIDGRTIGHGTSLDECLQRTAGRRVRLRVKDQSDNPPREVAVRPITGGAYEEISYRAWVAQNEAIVHAASAGRLGYVHIPAMSYEAYQQFLVDLDAEVYGKQGLVIDVRYNGGGHTATFFLDVLMRRSVIVKTFRGGGAADSGQLSGNRVLNRPTVLLANQGSASNAEMFVETYRRLGLGKIVGQPTAGAVIWTWRPSLIDGTMMGMPRMRVTTLDGEDLEGRGRPVDVEVVLPLGEPSRGRDPQLEEAARVLLAQIGEG